MQNPVPRFSKPNAPRRMAPKISRLEMPRIGPRNEKSLREINTIAVSTLKTASVATAATKIGLYVWPPIGVANLFAIHSMGHRMTEKANTYVANPAYCFPSDAPEVAQLCAIQLISM